MKKFTAATMSEALTLVEEALGEDAVIVKTESIREKGTTDNPPREYVEVWAQLSADASSLPENEAASQEKGDVIPPLPGQINPEIIEYVQRLQDDLHNVHTQLEGLSLNMNWLGAGAGSSRGELADYIAAGIVQKLPSTGGIRQTVDNHIVALIGPTGVGKTTLIGKLASQLSLVDSLSIGVLSTDTIRIGGIDPLRAVCGHLGVPLEVAYRPEDIGELLRRLAECDLVLIDTPGVSQRNEEQLTELQAFLKAADPSEVHLVLSATTGTAVIREILYRYAIVQPDQVIITKLDEASDPLDIFSVLVGTGLAVSYFSAGALPSSGLIKASPETISHLLSQA